MAEQYFSLSISGYTLFVNTFENPLKVNFFLISKKLSVHR